MTSSSGFYWFTFEEDWMNPTLINRGHLEINKHLWFLLEMRACIFKDESEWNLKVKLHIGFASPPYLPLLPLFTWWPFCSVLLKGHIMLLGVSFWERGSWHWDNSCHSTKQLPNQTCKLLSLSAFFSLAFSLIFPALVLILVTFVDLQIVFLMERLCDVQCKVFFFFKIYLDYEKAMDQPYSIQVIQCLLFGWWIMEDMPMWFTDMWNTICLGSMDSQFALEHTFLTRLPWIHYSYVKYPKSLATIFSCTFYTLNHQVLTVMLVALLKNVPS